MTDHLSRQLDAVVGVAATEHVCISCRRIIAGKVYECTVCACPACDDCIGYHNRACREAAVEADHLDELARWEGDGGTDYDDGEPVPYVVTPRGRAAV
jgi:hypothetical protein